ncbi:uncharacterized protein F4812DRAFT_432910 [Daldinia caldariorum]|uniref:uncharacterized protein n=1 Tax=Daldinia caldariorum TaxID=326644 RepID=UPI002008DC88|nr:uncharacterized protein F4812DRAFT_432910 [Daldinia caldariorum]KAI1466819.1 hypothetical protein F4812DRAFT_432910 [Daldinia caldariorum]
MSFPQRPTMVFVRCEYACSSCPLAFVRLLSSPKSRVILLNTFLLFTLEYFQPDFYARNMATKILTVLTLASSALAQMSGMDHMSPMTSMSSTASQMSEMTPMTDASTHSADVSGSYTTAMASTWASSVPAEASMSSSAMANETWTDTSGAMPNATSGGQIPMPGAGVVNGLSVSET